MANMDDMASDLTNAFFSKRLQYIRGEHTNHALKAFAPQIVQDPYTQAMASSLMLLPHGQNQVDKYVRSIGEALLGVCICLREEEEAEQTEPKKDGEETKTTEDNDAPSTPDSLRSFKYTARPRHPTIIGVMCLGWDGISARTAHHRTAPIGISLSPRYQNKGYGREAINWMLDWTFVHAGLHSVSISGAAYNPRALHLYKSLGFVEEGRRRETIWMNRGWWDEVEFGMTEGEWELLRKRTPGSC